MLLSSLLLFKGLRDVLQNNGSSVALREWRNRRPWYVRENDVREVRRCLVVGGVFGSMLEGNVM